LVIASHCDQILQEEGDPIEIGLSIFNLERWQIDKARLWLSQHPPTPETDEMLIGYGDSIVQIALRTLHYNVRQEVIPDFILQVAAARRLRRRDLEADILDTLGILHAFLGDYRSSIPYFEAALNLAQEIGDADGVNDYSAHLAEVRRSVDTTAGSTAHTDPAGIMHLQSSVTGKTKAADSGSERLVPLEKALMEAQEAGRSVDAAKVMYELGQVYFANGNHSQAVAYYRYALEVFQKHRLQLDYFNVAVDLAFALASVQQYGPCMELLTKLVELYQQHGFRWGKDVDPLFRQISSLYAQLLQVSQTTDSKKGRQLGSKYVYAKAFEKPHLRRGI
jgi:tetratricopeptide (TPR) repeat protein